MSRIGLAVVGVGTWGKNLVRNFESLRGCEILYCCDINPEQLEAIRELYPNLRTTTDLEEVLADKQVEAVAIATPAATHYELTRRILEAGRHVYVEKPFTLITQQAQELVDLAGAQGIQIMVGHLMEYHPAVVKIKELVDAGELGEVYYIYSQRVNLGKIRRDESSLWSLAPHDVSMVLYLFGEEPVRVTATGQAYLLEGMEDVVFLNLHFAGKKLAEIHVSWLDPLKERKLTIVGSEKMVVFDDMQPTEKVRIYDKGPDLHKDFRTYGEYISLREGDIYIPHIKMDEPLRLECESFLEALLTGRRPKSDGLDGVRVVRVLEAAQRSLMDGGRPVDLAQLTGEPV